jgi:hypothetical protein
MPEDPNHFFSYRTPAHSILAYRRLGRTGPDAFLLNLATSLGTLGQVFAATERHRDAAAVTSEGLMEIKPFVERYREALSGLRQGLSRNYLIACRQAGIEPTMARIESAMSPPETSALQPEQKSRIRVGNENALATSSAFNVAVDSRRRACDITTLNVGDVACFAALSPLPI